MNIYLNLTNLTIALGRIIGLFLEMKGVDDSDDSVLKVCHYPGSLIHSRCMMLPTQVCAGMFCSQVAVGYDAYNNQLQLRKKVILLRTGFLVNGYQTCYGSDLGNRGTHCQETLSALSAIVSG